MTNEQAIEVLKYDRKAYQEMIDANVNEGTISGDGGKIKGKWKGNVLELYQRQVEVMEMAIKALQAQADGDLISRQSLYNKIAEMEEFSKLDLLETKPQIDGKININYAWYLAKLMDRTRFLKMIADEPSVKGE